MRFRHAPAGLLVLALVGCGSTVTVGGPAGPRGGLASDGLSAGSGDGALPTDSQLTGGQGAASGTGGTSVPGSSTGIPDGDQGGDGGTSGGGRSASGAGNGGTISVRNGPGVSDKSIALGFQWYTQSEEGEKALGIAYDYGDPLEALRSAVNHVNRTGGIAGRKLDLQIYYNEYGPNSAGSYDVDAQTTCDHFTKDTKVFAFAPVHDNGVLRSCLDSRGVLAFGATRAELDAKELGRTPTYFDTTATTPETASRGLVDALARSPYFTESWNTAVGAAGGTAPVKVGILHADTPSWKRTVTGTLLPELARRGVKVDPDDIVEFRRNQSPSEASDTIASIQSAVLRFRGNGVTHVIPTDAGGLGFFALAAERQGYRPRYGLTSNAAGQAVVDGGAPKQQMQGALGVGWMPALDLRDTRGTYAGPGKAECVRVMKEQGLSYPPGSLAEGVMLSFCDLVFLLDRTVEAIPAGQPVTAASAARALEGIGSGFRFSALPGGSYGPGKHVPITAGWGWAWDADCGCGRYTTPSFRLR